MMQSSSRSRVLQIPLAFLALVAAGLHAAYAQSLKPEQMEAGVQSARVEPSRNACSADARKLCPSEFRAGDRQEIVACMEANRTRVSTDCMAEHSLGQSRPATGVEHAYTAVSNDPRLTLRYQRGECDGKAPLVVFVHGGSWSRGDKDSGAGHKATYFSTRGYAFASVNYRLVPVVTIQESAQDIADAIGWLVENADELKIDPDNIILQGHSAGAHLAALVALDDRYLRAAGVEPARIRAISLLDGAGYDIPLQMRIGENASLYRRVFGDDPADWTALSPITYVQDSPEHPDAIIHHMEGRRSSKVQSDGLRDAILRVGSEAEVYIGIGKTHKSLNRDFGVPGDVPSEQVLAFLASRVPPCNASTTAASLESRFNTAQAALDRDSSGSLSRSEVLEMHRPHFDKADIDTNGTLSPAELQGLLGSLLPPRKSGRRMADAAPPLKPTSGLTSWADIDAYIEQMVQELPLEGANLVVLRRGELVHRKNAGLYDEHTEIPIASATKWLTSALIMTLVDDGKLDLDKPISSYLDWATGPKGKATLRQILSHTGGFGTGHLGEQPRTWTLEQSAREAFARPAIGPPGKQFRYGGVGMQIAAYIAEHTLGKPYAQLFEERLARPLGMHHTYIGFAQKREVRRSISNPIAAAGGYSSAADYARFLEMIASNGEFRGTRILSAEAIHAMFRDYTNGSASLGKRTNVGKQTGYGLGAWCIAIQSDGQCTQMQSGGAFGTAPVVAIDEGTIVLLMAKDRMPHIRGYWAEVSDAIRDVLSRS